jgi:mannose-1-phosphate guanylyltransferase
MLHPLIMAGGGGTRFWPKSRQKRPKQFLSLGNERTFLQQAFDRVDALVPPDQCWVVTADTYRAETCRQLPTVPGDHIIGEPCGRDTAACIALAAALIARQDASAFMLVMPADHVIDPVPEFHRAVNVAQRMAEEHPKSLVTFGVRPSYPAVGYGYIQRGDEVTNDQGIGVFQVKSFREKPNHETAEKFVASGEYFWNSGIFVWKAATILDAIRQRQSKLYEAVSRIATSWNSARHAMIFRNEYDKLEKVSIDHAVMEQASDVLVVQAPFRWDDMGSWLAVERMHPHDKEGNTILAKHCGLRTRNCVIVAHGDQLIATVGVKDLLIIQDGNATLVADRREEGTIKQIVEFLKTKGLENYV